MSLSDLPNLEPSAASQLFRGISEPARSDYGLNTDIAELADDKAEGKNSNITTALNDFTSIFSNFHEHDSSNINYRDVRGFAHGNIFKSAEGRSLIDRMSSIFQNDIYMHNMKNDGGLRYALDGSSIKDSAKSFAAADIKAIEKSHVLAQKEKAKRGEKENENQEDKGKTDTKLSAGEARSAHHDNYDLTYSRLIREVNIDDDSTTISAKEYASYLIAVDALRYDEATGEYSFDMKNADGLITREEAKLGSKIDNKTLLEFAKQIYEEYYSGFFG